MAILLVGLGCSTPAEIIVVVDSDLQPGEELSIVEVTVSAGTADAQTQRFDLAETELPFSLSAASRDGAAHAVRISVDGLDASEVAIVQQHAMLSFVPGRSIRLDIPLARSCSYVEDFCDTSTETCSQGACIPRERDSGALPDAPNGDPSRLFDGPSAPGDAGSDAGPDAGPACVEDEPCSPPRSCMTGEMRCGAEPTCEVSGMMPAGTPCGSGRVCNAQGECGA
ncbi:MAG: hypothetical protein AB8I08_18500 [Sandaracinaceae bacterium]